jgi:ketosteroid isomerase-like protein
MLRLTAGPLTATVFVTALVTAQESVPPALQAMADTEREFARTAKVKGIRDSFLDFFADDAIAFAPEPTSSRARLLKQPARPFSVHELLWEPRFGDIATSGEIGWLTGPSTFIDHEAPDKKPHYGNYLSVWRKQPDGRWRVFIDIGIPTPAEVSFGPGFTRMPSVGRYAGKEGKDAATQSLRDADRQLNGAIAGSGAAKAYGDRLASASRLHRGGVLPLVGAKAIVEWLDAHASGLATAAGGGEAAASGDFGYTYGTYTIAGATPQSGAYVRVWTRDAAGKWLVAADVAEPTRR